jgi:ubiquinone/menaquinone biosynthesis C-methylase UbiE
MSVYEGEYADLYDLFYAEKPYDQEVEFTDRLLRAQAQGPSRRLLDVACGTGQHAVRFAAKGWEVVGVDLSADMLRRAQTRPGGDGVTFLHQDMRELSVPGEPFDAVTCLFDSIGYGVTNDAVTETLSRVRRHLRPGGLFVAEFWHAPPMLAHYDPVRVREWETSGGRILRISRTTLDVVAQLAQVEYSVYQLREDGTYGFWGEVHKNRYFLVQEMDLLLRSGGFEPLRWLAGYDSTAQLDEKTWHVVVLARVAEGSR